jgi:alpha-glucosidase
MPPELPDHQAHALTQPGAAVQPAIIPIGPATLTSREGNRFIFTGVESRAQVRLTILAADLAKVELLPEGMDAPPRSWSVAKAEEEWPEVSVELEEEKTGGRWIRTNDMSIRVTLAPVPFQMQFYNADGILLNADAPDGLCMVRQDPDPTPALVQRGEWGARCAKILLAGEHFFGFGERTGKLNKHGSRVLLWNFDPHMGHSDETWAMYSSIPFFINVREQHPPLTYALLLDSAALTEVDLGATRADRLTFGCGAGGGALTYYFFAGSGEEAVQSILARYTELTGRMSLPPRWALGNHQCRWSYYPDSQVRDLAQTFRARNLPCDALWLDIDYMDGYRDFTWDPQRFPDPRGLSNDLHAQGFKLVTIVDPGVKQEPTYPIYQQGVESGYFCRTPDGQVFHGPVWPGMTAFPDYSRAEVRAWWGEQQAALTGVGVDGIWNDMSEPSLIEAFAPQPALPPGRTLAPEVQHGANGQPLSHAEFHNAYGAMMARAAYEGLERLHPGKRPFVLSRSIFAGSQRFTALWTGDNSSTWEHLHMAIPQCLNIGLSGIPFVGVDVGGFWGDSNGELLARWTQLGALLPFCRNHSAIGTIQQEPWAFGEPFESIIRRYLELRYRLLPYLTTLFHEAATTGAPVMRPLFWHYLDDLAAREIEDQFLLGRDLLVAPVYKEGASARRLYLPAGEWFLFWSGERFQGPGWIEVRAPLDELPLLVHGGAILPLGPVMQHTEERPTDPLTLALYASARSPDADESFRLYEDDGETTGYRSGDFCQTRARWRWDSASQLTITLGAPQGPYRAERRHLQIEAHLPFPASQAQPAVHAVRLSGSVLEERPASDDDAGWSARATITEVIVTIQLEETWTERAITIDLA